VNGLWPREKRAILLQARFPRGKPLYSTLLARTLGRQAREQAANALQTTDNPPGNRSPAANT